MIFMRLHYLTDFSLRMTDAAVVSWLIAESWCCQLTDKVVSWCWRINSSNYELLLQLLSWTCSWTVLMRCSVLSLLLQSVSAVKAVNCLLTDYFDEMRWGVVLMILLRRLLSFLNEVRSAVLPDLTWSFLNEMRSAVMPDLTWLLQMSCHLRVMTECEREGCLMRMMRLRDSERSFPFWGAVLFSVTCCWLVKNLRLIDYICLTERCMLDQTVWEIQLVRGKVQRAYRCSIVWITESKEKRSGRAWPHYIWVQLASFMLPVPHFLHSYILNIMRDSPHYFVQIHY